jgi:hypothetical protein
MFHSVQSSGLQWTADLGIMFVIIQSLIQWTPVDFDWTLSPLDCDWTLKSGLQSSGSPVDWTGLDWTPVDWALYQSIWPGKMATGIHWSPLESTGVHMDYVGEGKDLMFLKISLLA